MVMTDAVESTPHLGYNEAPWNRRLRCGWDTSGETLRRQWKTSKEMAGIASSTNSIRDSVAS